MINIKDVFLQVVFCKEWNFQELVSAPLFVPDNLSALRVLNQFKAGGTHMALVLDEYGNRQGMVTLNDFMEAIIGETEAEEIDPQPEILEERDGKWLVDGQLSTERLKNLLAVSKLYEEGRDEYQTAAGMVLMLLGRIPVLGDHVEWNNFRFEVVEMAGNRIRRVLIARLAKEGG